ncbi:GH32 C-terminal domain-containing protein [Streptomyces paradoxus]|uniref:GH32 C-terminal domain-containing protein n=1 Tax=Streptomyces paradoxus TaxID=66375 RepID=UPI00381A5AEE
MAFGLNGSGSGHTGFSPAPLTTRVCSGQQWSDGYTETVLLDDAGPAGPWSLLARWALWTEVLAVAVRLGFHLDQERLKALIGEVKLRILVDWWSVDVFGGGGEAVITDQGCPRPLQQRRRGVRRGRRRHARRLARVAAQVQLAVRGRGCAPVGDDRSRRTTPGAGRGSR